MDSHRAEENNSHENNENHKSGDTSPDNTPTLFSGELHRSDSKETLVSSDSTEVESNPSIVYPPPPANTPATQSAAGDIAAMDLDYADEQLNIIPVGPTPPNSVAGPIEGEGKAHLRARVRGDVPLLQQLFKRPPKLVKKVRKMTRYALEAAAAPSIEPRDENHVDHFHEHTTWVTLAKEDIARGLVRLVMAAKDLHKIDENVSVEQYYCENLAEVLKEAEIKFDPNFLE